MKASDVRGLAGWFRRQHDTQWAQWLDAQADAMEAAATPQPAASSYDQGASAKWRNVWLFVIAVHVAVICLWLGSIERAIRESAPPRYPATKVTP